MQSLYHSRSAALELEPRFASALSPWNGASTGSLSALRSPHPGLAPAPLLESGVCVVSPSPSSNKENLLSLLLPLQPSPHLS